MEEWMRDIKRAIPRDITKAEEEEVKEGEDGEEGEEDEEVTLSFTSSSDLLYKSAAMMILPMDPLTGVFELTADAISFFSTSKGAASDDTKMLWVWPLSSVREVYRRVYLLRQNAIEIFFSEQKPVFFNFPGDEVSRVILKLTTLNIPKMINFTTVSPERILTKSKITRSWMERSISNFEYLVR